MSVYRRFVDESESASANGDEQEEEIVERLSEEKEEEAGTRDDDDLEEIDAQTRSNNLRNTHLNGLMQTYCKQLCHLRSPNQPKPEPEPKREPEKILPPKLKPDFKKLPEYHCPLLQKQLTQASSNSRSANETSSSSRVNFVRSSAVVQTGSVSRVLITSSSSSYKNPTTTNLKQEEEEQEEDFSLIDRMLAESGQFQMRASSRRAFAPSININNYSNVVHQQGYQVNDNVSNSCSQEEATHCHNCKLNYTRQQQQQQSTISNNQLHQNHSHLSPPNHQNKFNIIQKQQHQHHHHYQSSSSRYKAAMMQKQQSDDINKATQQTAAPLSNSSSQLNQILQTNDPVLYDWLKAMRFDSDLEEMGSLSARTLTIDQYTAGALSVRNSHVAIQESRKNSMLLLDSIDQLIAWLPLTMPKTMHLINQSSTCSSSSSSSMVMDYQPQEENCCSLEKYQLEFTELWRNLMSLTQQIDNDSTSSMIMTETTTNYNQHQHHQQQLHHQHQTIIVNGTPRKQQAAKINANQKRPLEFLRAQMRDVCIELANHLNDASVVLQLDQQEQQALHNHHHHHHNAHDHHYNHIRQQNANKIFALQLDNGLIESLLRKLKELFGRFIEIYIRTQCANIVRALDYDFYNNTIDQQQQQPNNHLSDAQSKRLNRISSIISLKPSRPFETSHTQLPLKWALIALWQLTQDDSYLCRTLTEKWQTLVSSQVDDHSIANATGLVEQTDSARHNRHQHNPHVNSNQSRISYSPSSAGVKSPCAKKRLDYSTKYDNQNEEKTTTSGAGASSASIATATTTVSKTPFNDDNHDDGADKYSLRWDYQKLYQICQQKHQGRLPPAPQHWQQSDTSEQNKLSSPPRRLATSGGALNSALRNKQQACQITKQLSTIELLVDIIISQPNKHERLDMMNFIQDQAQHDKLIDIDECNQSISAAVYTSNQYKVAALRILNHLCVNDTAVKTILRCFSTPPPTNGQPIPENKIIRSIFECYQTAQEHIYQNETHIKTSQLTNQRLPVSGGANTNSAAAVSSSTHNHLMGPARGRKRPRQGSNSNMNSNPMIIDMVMGGVQDHHDIFKQQADNYDQKQFGDDYSDYGSRQTQSHTTTTNTITTTTKLEMAGGTGSVEDSSFSSGTTSTSESDDLVVREAIMLLIQITNPFHKSNQGHDYYTLIGRFSIDLLVKYLTQIMKIGNSREMILLSLTALANISFISTKALEKHSTNAIMLEMFRTNRKRSKDMELRDQAVTILANTANNNIKDIVGNGGIIFLLSCLESCPLRMANYKQITNKLKCNNNLGSIEAPESNGQNSTYEAYDLCLQPRTRRPIDFGENYPDALDSCPCELMDEERNKISSNSRDEPIYQLVSINGNHMIRSSPPRSSNMSSAAPLYIPPTSLSACQAKLSANDLAAMERIHQKTAIAFSRMSADHSTVRMIKLYGGIKKMVDLCKISQKRNYSDTVLIACIVTLQKMAKLKLISEEEFKSYNALDLIELPWRKALDIYGSGSLQDHQNNQRMAYSEV